MRIVFVLECANAITNGTAATCYRFAEELQKKGHEIIMLGEELKPGQTSPFVYYGLKHFTFPVFEKLIIKDGFTYVHCDVATIYNAIKGADLVHLFIPFKLCSTARLIAEMLHVPVTAAFHLQPQNITSAIGFGKARLLNHWIYQGFRNYLYNHVRHVHCPSQMIRRELENQNYDNNAFHVISNGITPFFHRVPSEKPEAFKDKIVVTMSGRLAVEKRQDLIIKAIARSPYNEKIQLVLCGKGPCEEKLIRLSKKKGLANPLFIKFCNQEELRDILSYTDIYVHASDFEIEGISAIEAIACGAVPLISNSRLSATSSLALTHRCIFKHGSARSLAKGIAYFIEHEAFREKLSQRYQEKAKDFHLDKMVGMMEEMFAEAVEDYQNHTDICQTRLRLKDLQKKRGIAKKLIEKGVISEVPEDLR